MSADTDALRRAAALVRERAEREALLRDGDPYFTTEASVYERTWAPGVVLLLPPLLERLAGRADMVMSSVGSPILGAAVVGSNVVGFVEAVSFARAYLGEEDPT